MACEIHQQLIAEKSNRNDVETTLQVLKEIGLIHQKDFFYGLSKENELYRKRLDRNTLAKKYIKKGKRISRFIACFPFVRAVFLSGSLSKDCMDEDGDIDYFIITAPNRLWVARTLLILFKKIALFNSYKYFCLNYFIDESEMTIGEQNLYTATEVATLVPTFGKHKCKEFMAKNNWIAKFRPNAEPLHFNTLPNRSFSIIKRPMEFLLSGRLGDWMEQKFLNMTSRYWEKKFSTFSDDDYALSIKSQRHVSQVNPENFQKKVILAFNDKVTAFEKKHSISLK
jgi:hypothetical protein